MAFGEQCTNFSKFLLIILVIESIVKLNGDFLRHSLRRHLYGWQRKFDKSTPLKMLVNLKSSKLYSVSFIKKMRAFCLMLFLGLNALACQTSGRFPCRQRLLRLYVRYRPDCSQPGLQLGSSFGRSFGGKVNPMVVGIVI
jgi:hypothetical protein